MVEVVLDVHPMVADQTDQGQAVVPEVPVLQHPCLVVVSDRQAVLEKVAHPQAALSGDAGRCRIERVVEIEDPSTACRPAAYSLVAGSYHGAAPRLGEHLNEQRVRRGAIQNRRGPDPCLDRVHAHPHFRDHAAGNDPVLDQALRLGRGNGRQELPVDAAHARDVRQDVEPGRLDGDRDRTGNRVGIDVERLAVPRPLPPAR